jgi:outer membrane immunogenic protein
MRCLLAALGLIGLLNSAFAADYEPPTLRGSDTFVPAFPTYFSWQGFYAGGQVSYTSASTNFTQATQPLVAFSLRNLTILAQMMPDQWQVLGNRATGAPGFGGFLGYNIQWDNAVVGLELNYTHSSLDSVAPDSPIGRRQTVTGFITDVFVDASGSVHISDFATTRARFGWVIGTFMPYASLGFAFGRADMAISTLVTVRQTDPANSNNNIFFQSPNNQSKSGAYLYGYSGAGGVEVALTQNIFARGEYEYIQWQRIWSINSSMHNFRAALGVKF